MKYKDAMQLYKEAAVPATRAYRWLPNTTTRLARHLLQLERAQQHGRIALGRSLYRRRLLRALAQDIPHASARVAQDVFDYGLVRPTAFLARTGRNAGERSLRGLWNILGPNAYNAWAGRLNPTGHRDRLVPYLLGSILGGGSYALLPDKYKEKIPELVGRGIIAAEDATGLQLPKEVNLRKRVVAAGKATKDIANEIKEDTKTSVTGKSPEGYGTDTIASPKGSVFSLFNPISGLTGGVDYVPGKWIDFVQKFIPGEAGKTTAHMTAKMGAMTLLAAGLVGGYRALRHVNELRDMDAADRPGKDMASQLSTTFEGDLSGDVDEKKQKKAASETTPPGPHEVRSPGYFTSHNLTATTIPVGTFLLAAGLAYKGVDSAFDKLRNKRLSAAIEEKEQAMKRLITARAQLAKGNLSLDTANGVVNDLADSAVYTKAASQDKEAVIKETVQLFGALTSAIILASAIGSYAYTSASDENNIKYKAYKKALKEYAKTKSGITPITTLPSNASEYFSSIDAVNAPSSNLIRRQPEYDTDALNKPISVSF